jgi:hypothetical protein
MNYKTLSLSALFLLGTSGLAQAETQVLDLQATGTPQLPQETASNSAGGCGQFALESLTLNAVPGESAAGGTVNIVNAANQPLAAQKFASGQVGKLSVKLKQLGEDSVEDVAVQIISRGEDGEINVVETVQASESGEVQFQRALGNGDYQVALSCGALAGAGFGTAAGGVAALAAGVSAVAIGTTSNSGGSNTAGAASLQPRVDPAPLQANSASESGDFEIQ